MLKVFFNELKHKTRNFALTNFHYTPPNKVKIIFLCNSNSIKDNVNKKNPNNINYRCNTHSCRAKHKKSVVHWQQLHLRQRSSRHTPHPCSRLRRHPKLWAKHTWRQHFSEPSVEQQHHLTDCERRLGVCHTSGAKPAASFPNLWRAEPLFPVCPTTV